LPRKSTKKPRTKTPRIKKQNYKSQFERTIANYLREHRIEADYEPRSFPYVKPSRYTPDWEIAPNRYIEAKGYFAPADRAKLVAFKAQYPDVEILLLFANSKNKLHRKAKMTYGEWAEKNGFRHADFKVEGIPKEWSLKD